MPSNLFPGKNLNILTWSVHTGGKSQTNRS